MKKKIRNLIFLGITSLFLFTGCDFAPSLKVVSPELPSPKSITKFTKNKTLPQTPVCSKYTFWDMIKDKNLKKLIKIALKNNEEVKIASVRVQALSELYGFKRAELFPVLGYKAQVSRTKIPEKIEKDIEDSSKAISLQFAQAGFQIPQIDIENPKNSFNLLFSVSYELDFWGKLRNAKKAAYANLLAMKAAQRITQITIASTIINLYYSLIALNEQKKTLEKIKKDLEALYQIGQKQYSLGLVSEDVVEKIKIELEEVSQKLVELNQKKKELQASLAYLVGKSPKELFEEEIKIPEESLRVSFYIPPFLSSHVLACRPDIQMAFEKLRAANFEIGVAKANYFPDITLTGYTGFLSSEFKNLFKSESFFWSIGAGLTGPLFDFGRTKRIVKYKEEIKKQAFLNYIKTVKQAFKEVYIGLNNLEFLKKQIEKEKKILESRKKLLSFIQKRYNLGLVPCSKVLSQEISYLKARLNLVQLKLNLIQTYFYIYKALGLKF